MSLSNYPTIRPSLILDFQKAEVVDPRITFTRASSATRFNSYGVLETVGNNVPRIDFNPTTLVCNGLLVEESRTNSIRNNTMVGAVAGTPGTAPTNWLISTATGNLTTREIVGTGVENGINYIDVRFVASGSFTASIYADSSTGVAASNGQTWTSSFYVKLAGGSLTNVTVQLSIVENDAGGNFLAGADSATFVPTAAALSTQRQSQTRTNTNASTAFEWSRVRVNFSGAGDVTLRIGLPQLEQGAFATSVIPTSTATVTRQADVASMTGTNFSSWYNASEGTLYGEAFVHTAPNNANIPCILSFDDGTANNRIQIYRANSNAVPNLGFVVVSGGSTSTVRTTASTQSQPGKIAGAYKVDDFAASGNGSTPSTDTTGTVPTVTQAQIGNGTGSGLVNLNGWICRLAYYPARLTNAQLQALTAT